MGERRARRNLYYHHPLASSEKLREAGHVAALQQLQECHKVGFGKNALQWLARKSWQQRVAVRHFVSVLGDGHRAGRIRLMTKTMLVPVGCKALHFHDSFPQIVTMPATGGLALPVEEGGAQVLQGDANPSL